VSDDAIFAEAVRKVAPRPFDVYTKLLTGAFARAELAEHQRDELKAELAERKQAERRPPAPPDTGGLVEKGL
jgi:hypothetical protein